jgi:hypothetical protein
MTTGRPARLPVLVAAAGERWETEALELLGTGGGGLVVHRRCVDLPDLLAAARTGTAALALVAAGLPGLDADAVSELGRAAWTTGWRGWSSRCVRQAPR